MGKGGIMPILKFLGEIDKDGHDVEQLTVKNLAHISPF